jgi:hypothetical protein
MRSPAPAPLSVSSSLSPSDDLSRRNTRHDEPMNAISNSVEGEFRLVVPSRLTGVAAISAAEVGAAVFPRARTRVAEARLHPAVPALPNGVREAISACPVIFFGRRSRSNRGMSRTPSLHIGTTRP